MKIAIAFATLSGNTLAVAQEIESYLESKGISTTIYDLLEANADDFKKYDLVFLGGSTYSDGDLNPIAEMFFGAAGAHHHTCDHTKFALFALGDSSYPQFAQSGQVMFEKLQQMDACILSPTLELDGPPTEEMISKVKSWVDDMLEKNSSGARYSH
ncbi:MAG TPA: flavodoxin domain-containing protein [Patescibacteria group bacterium]